MTSSIEHLYRKIIATIDPDRDSMKRDAKRIFEPPPKTERPSREPAPRRRP